MIQPANKFFNLIKGVTFEYRFQFLNGSPVSSAPIDLEGWTGQWSVRWKSPSAGNTIYTTGHTAGNSGIFFGGDNNDPSNGIIDLIISASDTAVLPWTTATHQFAVTDPTGTVLVLLNGGINVVGTFP